MEVSGLSCARAPDGRTSTPLEDVLNPDNGEQAIKLESGYSLSFTPLHRSQRKNPPVNVTVACRPQPSTSQVWRVESII